MMAGPDKKFMLELWVRLLGLALFCLGLLSATGCKQVTPQNELEIIKEKGELRVLIRNNATCYYEGPEGLLGFEYDLVKGFADHLGLKLNLIVTHSFKEMIPSLLRGDADLIAAGFSITQERQQKVVFGPPYMEVQQQVVGRRGGPSPENVAELVGQPLWINAGTSYEERLRELKQQFPHLSWLPVSDYETEELLEMVWRGIIPLTIADSNIVAVNRRYYPQLKIHFAIEEGQQIAWAVHPQHRYLLAAIEEWFSRLETSALLQRLKQHYYGHLRFSTMWIWSNIIVGCGNVCPATAITSKPPRASMGWIGDLWLPSLTRNPTGIQRRLVLQGYGV